MIVYDWPSSLIPMAQGIPLLDKNTASPGASLTGAERVISTDAGRWRWTARYGLRSITDIRVFRAIVALAEGRANVIRVPLIDILTDPASLAGTRDALTAAIGATGLPHSDDTRHDDGTGYDQELVYGAVTAGAAQGATTFSVTVQTGYTIEPGQFFSDVNRLYQIKTATLTSGTTYTVTFLPRLRDAYAAGTTIRFDGLRCLMRVESVEPLGVVQDRNGFGDFELKFVEAIS